MKPLMSLLTKSLIKKESRSYEALAMSRLSMRDRLEDVFATLRLLENSEDRTKLGLLSQTRYRNKSVEQGA